MKLNYKKIAADLTAFAARNDYEKPRCLRVELTSFQPTHKAQRGRNGVGELVELRTQVIEAEAVYVDSWARSNGIAVYVKARTRSDHGFEADGGTLLRIRDRKGKYHTIEVRTRHETSEIEVGGLERVLGQLFPSQHDKEGFAAHVEEDAAKVVKLVGAGAPSGDSEADARWKMDCLAREFSKRYYQELIKYEIDDYRKERLNEVINAAGCKLVTVFQFTDRFWGIFPKYVDCTTSGIEFGYMTGATYNSLPVTLKISKAKGIRTVKLKDLGVEEPGYYSHHDNMQVLPEQAEEARRFASRFRSKRSRTFGELIKKVG